MSDRIHALAQQLLGRASVEECSIEELTTLVNKYPYFAPAQFLLLQKLKLENADGYNSQLQKAVLYYHDPVQFEYFINSDKFYTELPTVQQPAEQQPSEIKEQEEIPPLELSPETDTIELNSTPFSSMSSEIETEEVADEIIEEETTGKDFNEDALVEETSLPAIGETSIKDDPEEESFEEDQINIGKEKGEEIEVESPVSEEKPDVNEEAPVAKTKIENEQSEDEEPVLDEEENEADGPELPKLKIPFTTIANDAAAEVSATDPLFEPFHTVDYFASQGIKPNTDDAPKDNFGKQLKSFTQWLKTMKRLPAAEVQKTSDLASENKVVNMATQSIDDADIVTEAMAEVWLKQGNKEKAIEIFSKLSLLDPSKKAFFAAKIDQLKHS